MTSNRDNSLGGGLLAATGTNSVGGIASKASDAINTNLGVNFDTKSSSSDKEK